MAEVILKNSGLLSADYDGEAITFGTNEVSTTIINGITATKTVDKAFWVNGALMYTVTVNNSTGIDLENIVLIDSLSEIVVVDSDYGVRINDVSSTYTYFANVLNVPIASLEDGATVAITFQVLQV